MMSRLIRWAREGSIATLTVVTLASAPTAAQAGWFDDVKSAASGLAAVFNPSHDIGKFALGSVMVGGGLAVAAGADLAVAAGAAAIVGTAITGGAILLVAGGAALAIWGGYKLWKHVNSDETRPLPPDSGTGPGGTADPRPGRVEPGAGTGTTGTPGSGGTVPGGTSTTPGTNIGRPTETTPGRFPGHNGPTGPSTTPTATGAGMSNGLPR